MAKAPTYADITTALNLAGDVSISLLEHFSRSRVLSADERVDALRAADTLQDALALMSEKPARKSRAKPETLDA